MIPIALPFAILVVSFLVLLVFSLAVLMGSDSVLGLVQRKMAPAAEKSPLAETPPAPRVEGYLFPEQLYYHPAHTWVFAENSDTARIGMDEFAAKLVGPPVFVSSPKAGQRMRKGENAWTIRKKGVELNVPAPMDGEIVAVNERVFQNPRLLVKEPYDAGWLVRIKSRDLARSIGNLLTGAAARDWMRQSATELRSMFSGKLGLVFQDGGLPQEGLADYLEPAEWQDLAARIFGVGTEE